MVACCFAVTALAGCEKSVDVSEPGVYQGQTDPLIQAQKRPEQQERLRDRFVLSQSDR